MTIRILSWPSRRSCCCRRRRKVRRRRRPAGIRWPGCGPMRPTSAPRCAVRSSSAAREARWRAAIAGREAAGTWTGGEIRFTFGTNGAYRGRLEPRRADHPRLLAAAFGRDRGPARSRRIGPALRHPDRAAARRRQVCGAAPSRRSTTASALSQHLPGPRRRPHRRVPQSRAQLQRRRVAVPGDPRRRRLRFSLRYEGGEVSHDADLPALARPASASGGAISAARSS